MVSCLQLSQMMVFFSAADSSRYSSLLTEAESVVQSLDRVLQEPNRLAEDRDKRGRSTNRTFMVNCDVV